MSAAIKVLDIKQTGGELIGDVSIKKSRIRGGVLEKARTAALIDEIPVLAILGAASEDGLIVRDAAELRVKETDRIQTIADNFQRMGLAIEIHPDGFQVPGRQRFHAAELDSGRGEVELFLVARSRERCQTPEVVQRGGRGGRSSREREQEGIKVLLF